MVIPSHTGDNRQPKKSIADGLTEIERSGVTSDPLFSAYLQAYAVNLAAGGSVIAPWEVIELREQAPEWIWAADALMELRKKGNQRRAAANWQQQITDQWRNKHPNL